MLLDHLFVLVRPWRVGQEGEEAADELADALEGAGLVRGSGRRHAGQGTANLRFPVGRFFLELLFVTSRAETGDPRTAPLSLLERLDDPACSPFGFASRSSDASRPEAPYPSVPYRPAYLPPDRAIAIASGVPPTEPLWFHLPFSMPDGPPPADGSPAPTIARDPEPPGLVSRLDAVTLGTPTPLGGRSAAIARDLGIREAPREPGQPGHRLTLRFEAADDAPPHAPHPHLPVTIERRARAR